MGNVFGNYELLKRIAGGGMGEVFLARQVGLQGFEKLCVVKTLLPHLTENEAFLTMFLDEARLAARLNHPNVCAIFELGEVEGTYFIAMEYVQGEDMRRVQKTAEGAGTALPIPLICRIISDAAAGLHYSHELTDNDGQPIQLVHRDVSPQNILVTYDGAVKVIDFGVAKAAGRATHTTTGQLKGKLAYMSPEQAAGMEIDRRTDIFALGVILHEFLTGRRLFSGNSEIQTLRAVTECHVEPPSSINPAVPPSLDAVVMKALARDPDERFLTAEDLRHALEEWLIHSREAASQVHLKRFMQGLYKERLEQERQRGPLWDVDQSERSNPSKPNLSAVSRLQQRSRPSQPSPVQAPPPAKSKLPLIAGAVVGALVLVGVGAAVALKSGDAPAGPVAAHRPHLSVDTDPPGVSVKLAGRSLGVTPLVGLEVDATRGAELELEGAGLARRVEWVEIASDLKLSYSMEKAKAQVRLESDPPGATVQVGGQVLGTTPLVWSEAEPNARVSFRFQLAGYKPATSEVVVADGAVVHPQLEKSEKAERPEGGGTKKGPAIPTFDD